MDGITIAVFLFFSGLSCSKTQEPFPLIPISDYSFLPVIRSKMSVPRGRSANIGDCYIRHYIGNRTDVNVVYNLKNATAVLRSPFFDAEKTTVLYIHGYVELSTDMSVSTVVEAYLERGDHNILVLDWSNMAYGQYFGAAINVFTVGRATGATLHRLARAGLPLARLHVVGHSLGAHLSGVMGTFLQTKNYTLPRITGLDPALPGFYPALFGPPLTRDSAKYVEVIHTDSGQYGVSQHIGHLDFWPNGGRAKQPGCVPFTIYFTSEDFCSHWRSWRFWAESVRGGQFLARQCSSYDDFLRGDCWLNNTTVMGLHVDTNMSGDFYLLTATREPFALGDRGAG